MRRAGWAALAASLLVACGTTLPTGCPEGTEDCGDGVCAVLATDSEHCGACGNACDPGLVCDGAGTCQASCQARLLLCGDTCTDPMTSQERCGASGDCAGPNAGVVCAPGQVCAGGTCADQCQPGFVRCDGRCIDPRLDRTYCGATSDCQGSAAGITCGAGLVCSEGECTTECAPGLIQCGADCVDPMNDPVFCGASGSCEGEEVGVICEPGFFCAGGACASSCPPGTVECAGVCIDPLTDSRFCGASGSCLDAEAGILCEPGTVCAEGTCQTQCPEGAVRCGDRCIDPLTDRAFCGANGDCLEGNAGETCTAGQVCAAGVCATSCPLTQVRCDGRCIDPLSSNLYCGARGSCLDDLAGEACAPGEICSGGGCEATCQVELVECDGTCIDPETNRSFCGAEGTCTGAAAGTQCGPGEACVDGGCSLVCPTGLVACDGLCIEPETDPTFCGASANCAGVNAGEACGRREACITGACADVGGATFEIAIVDATDRGSWTSGGGHNGLDDSTPTGLSRSYLSFDLGPFAGTAVLSARLRVEIAAYSSSDATEDISVWDVDTDAPTVEATPSPPEPAVFVDLGSGARYARFSVAATDVGSVLEVPLRGPVFADVLDALGSDFTVGLAADTGGTVSFSTSTLQPSEPRILQLVIEYVTGP
jgi:hypothetical protein